MQPFTSRLRAALATAAGASLLLLAPAFAQAPAPPIHPAHAGLHPQPAAPSAGPVAGGTVVATPPAAAPLPSPYGSEPAGAPAAVAQAPANTTEAEPANTVEAAPARADANRTDAAPAETAATPPTALATAAAIADDQTQLKAITSSVGHLQTEAASARNDDSLTAVRQDAAIAQASADAFARARLAEVAAFDQQLKRYDSKTGRPRPHLTAEEAKDRADLLTRRGQVLHLAQAAEQAATSASGVYNTVANRRRNAFAAHIFERTASPLEAGFWTSIGDSLGPDAKRLERLVGDMGSTAMDAAEPRGLISLAFALLIAFALAVPGRRFAKRLIRRRVREGEAQTQPPPLTPDATHRQEASRDLGRSAHAVGVVLVDTLLPGLAAIAVNLGLTWGELISDKAEALAQAVVVAVFWGAAIVALSRQLAGDPEERLLPVSERLASHMRALPWLVALITGAGFLLNRINVVVGASVAATIAANCVISVAYAVVASLILVALGADREADGADADVRRPGRVLVSLALSAAIVLTIGSVLAGFTTFAALVSRQIFWIAVILALAYLLLRFVDDVVARLYAPRGWIGRLLTVVLNLRIATVDQLGLLTSALLQVVIVGAALTLALTPFGNGGDAFAPHFAHLGQAVHVGSITISPGSVGAGLASLVIGLILVHFVERWVDRRYLPVTDWDSGVRNSVSTGVRYIGVGLAILWALAAAGLGFQQIALVASALSVGIGFGLQQIVQNFVSGLILLVERPVKLGDWVSLGGGIEGDVQRIRVRSTEIRTFDRTTVIVPNSDLITKQVQNKTLGDPRGRVRLEVSVGAPADASRALQAILKLLSDDEEVLNDPPPRVFIDSLTTGGSVNYVCYAYVATPRDAVRIKSRLYGEVLDLFAREKIGFIGGPTNNIVEPGPELRAFVAEVAGRLRPAPPPAEPEPTSSPPAA